MKHRLIDALMMCSNACTVDQRLPTSWFLSNRLIHVKESGYEDQIIQEDSTDTEDHS